MIQRITSSQFRLDGVQRRGKEKGGVLTLLSEFAFSTKRFEGIIKGKERAQGTAVARSDPRCEAGALPKYKR